MLVSTIIANGQSLAAVPQTNFFTASDALFSVQSSWKDLYALLCEHNDDYFVTQTYLNISGFSPDANRQFFYNYLLPGDFYRLRLFQYQPDGNLYFPVEKMTLENYGNLQSTPGYRMMGNNLVLYTQNTYQNWCLFYYPMPVTLTTSTDLTYPKSMVPEIMAYQLAADIRRKQNLDYGDKLQRRDELVATMVRQLDRDDAKAESPKNVFAQGFAPYV